MVTIPEYFVTRRAPPSGSTHTDHSRSLPRPATIVWIKFSAVELQRAQTDHRPIKRPQSYTKDCLPTLMTEADAGEDPAVSAETLVRRLSSSPSQPRKVPRRLTPIRSAAAALDESDSRQEFLQRCRLAADRLHTVRRIREEDLLSGVREPRLPEPKWQGHLDHQGRWGDGRPRERESLPDSGEVEVCCCCCNAVVVVVDGNLNVARVWDCEESLRDPEPS